ncbi:MAG: hypothetical protein ACYCWW_05290 [Deltaproteobacteria bacterium]
MRHLLTLSLLSLLACASTAQTVRAAAGPSPAALFPLAVGNRWSYQVEFLGARQTLSVSIVSGQGGVFVDSRGQRYSVDSRGVRDEQRYLLREPLEPGRSWQSIVSLQSTERYRVVAVGETTDVPAGRFEGCVRIEGRIEGGGAAPSGKGASKAQLAEQTYCPGVGLVKVTTYEELQGQRGAPQWREELAAYRVAGT